MYKMFNIRTAMHSCSPGVVTDPSVDLNYMSATRAGTVVCPSAAADTALGSLLI